MKKAVECKAPFRKKARKKLEAAINCAIRKGIPKLKSAGERQTKIRKKTKFSKAEE